MNISYSFLIVTLLACFLIESYFTQSIITTRGTTTGGRPITTTSGRPITTTGGRPITTTGGRPITTTGGRPITTTVKPTTARQTSTTTTAKDKSMKIF
jgi:hypothetical protein